MVWYVFLGGQKAKTIVNLLLSFARFLDHGKGDMEAALLLYRKAIEVSSESLILCYSMEGYSCSFSCSILALCQCIVFIFLVYVCIYLCIYVYMYVLSIYLYLCIYVLNFFLCLFSLCFFLQ